MQESTKYTRDMGAVITRTVGGVETIFRNETGGTDLWDTLATTTDMMDMTIIQIVFQ